MKSTSKGYRANTGKKDNIKRNTRNRNIRIRVDLFFKDNSGKKADTGIFPRIIRNKYLLLLTQ